jgi:hypothetical protein
MKAFFDLARGDGIIFAGAHRRESGWGLDDGGRVDVVERNPSLK